MKMRSGFVSNSSSSSFIFAINKKPNGVKDLERELFEDKLGVYCEHFPDVMLEPKVAARVIYNRMRDDEEAILESIERGCMPGQPKYDHSGGDKEERKYIREKRKFAERQLRGFKIANHGKKVFVVELDEHLSKEQAIMEMGDTFELVPHIKVSHH